jgi:magnesium transporter
VRTTNGRRRDEGPVPLEEAAARCGQGGFVWLGLLEPAEEELAQVRDTFGLHELAVEDGQSFHIRFGHRPTVTAWCRTRRRAGRGR